MLLTVWEKTAIMINGTGICHVCMHAGINHACVHQGKLQLIDDQSLRHRLLEQFNLSRIEVGNPELPNFTFILQLQKGFSNIFWFHERVRSMQ